MSTFIDISGQKVRSVSSDPSNPTLGQIWYNSTTAQLRASIFNANGVWASGGNIPADFGGGADGFGVDSAAVVAGGFSPGAASYQSAAQEYNGSTWSSPTNMPYATGYTSTFGLESAGVVAGGLTSPGPGPGQGPVRNTSLEYNGSTWGSGGNMNVTRFEGAGFGIESAGVAAGGSEPAEGGGTKKSESEEYNGTSWSVGNAMNTARTCEGTGTESNGLAIGGNASFTAVEEYNGSTWTTGGSLPVGKTSVYSSGPGTNALAIAGYTPSPAGNSATVQAYDGSTWSSRTSVPSVRSAGGSSKNNGDTTSATIFGGDPTTTSTIEYTQGNQTVSIDTTAV